MTASLSLTEKQWERLLSHPDLSSYRVTDFDDVNYLVGKAQEVLGWEADDLAHPSLARMHVLSTSHGAFSDFIVTAHLRVDDEDLRVHTGHLDFDPFVHCDERPGPDTARFVLTELLEFINYELAKLDAYVLAAR